MMTTKETRTSAWNPGANPPILVSYRLGSKVALDVYDIYTGTIDHVEMDIEAAGKLLGELAQSIGAAIAYSG